MRRTVADIVQDRVIEKYSLLGHDTDKAPQLLDLQFWQRCVIDQDLSSGWIIEPGNKVQQRALARPIRSNNSYRLTLFDGQIDILQQWLLAEVLKVHTLEDKLLEWYRHGLRFGAVYNRWLSIEHLVNPVQRGATALHHVKHIRQFS